MVPHGSIPLKLASMTAFVAGSSAAAHEEKYTNTIKKLRYENFIEVTKHGFELQQNFSKGRIEARLDAVNDHERNLEEVVPNMQAYYFMLATEGRPQPVRTLQTTAVSVPEQTPVQLPPEQKPISFTLEQHPVHHQPEPEPVSTSAQPQPQQQQEAEYRPEHDIDPVNLEFEDKDEWEDEPEFVPPTPARPSLPTITNPKPQAQTIPDGAAGVKIEELGNINKYPVIMVVAGQGSGKSATMAVIMQRLSGYKVVASPKPLTKKMVGYFDLVFGLHPRTNEWTYYGSIAETDFDEHIDLSYHLHKAQSSTPARGSMLDFLWACRRESLNRQKGVTENREFWRCFYDEAADTFATGYGNPLDPDGKSEKAAQHMISTIVRASFINFRSQKIQVWIGTQSESVEIIGLKNLASTRDEAWHLYPGASAIVTAAKYGKPALAEWLKAQAKAGKGIALLEKQKTLFEVVTDLPSIQELSTITDVDTELFFVDQDSITEQAELVEDEEEIVDGEFADEDLWESSGLNKNTIDAIKKIQENAA